MSDTPRTDAQCWTSVDVETGKTKGSLGVVSADFARQLERELKRLRDAGEWIDKAMQREFRGGPQTEGDEVDRAWIALRAALAQEHK
jgi:hypothetical protein